ncbi:MAG: 30S ribosomal protein S6 [Akkermansiaceae bacterium]|nr:30S ribosomal protein S6 [Akkermansiaceae bacterium]
MRKYEALIVLNMKGSETLDELVAAISAKLTEAGASVKEVTNVGLREFAYESQHQKSGQYMLFAFEAEPQVIRAAREALAIDERVHYQYYRAK